MRVFPFIALLTVVCSCSHTGRERRMKDRDSFFIQRDSPAIHSDYTGKLNNLIWLPALDSMSNRIIVKQQRNVNADTLSATKIIQEVNAAWDGIRLVFCKISHDTIYVSIPSSDVLTKQMGSSGAYSYISSTTYTLTELKNIHFVNYDFEEGDHLGPGTMKRSDFNN
jgi:hypothetical protein